MQSTRLFRRFVIGGLGAAFLLAATAAWADSQFMDHTPQVLDLERLYSEAGYVFPTDSFPLSRKTLHEYALALQGRVAGKKGAIAGRIDTYLTMLNYRPGKLRMGGQIASNYQLLASTAGSPRFGVTQAPSSPQDESFAFSQWLSTADPIFGLGLYFGPDGGAEVAIKARIARMYEQYAPYLDGTKNLIGNFPTAVSGDPFPVNHNDIHTGYLYLPFGWGSLTFGRQQMQIGPTLDNTGLTASERIPFYDALRVRVPIGNLTMTWMISTLENRASVEDLELGSISSIMPTSNSPYFTTYNFGTNLIIYDIHYFEYHFKRLRLGIGAQQVLSRPNNMFNFGDFFPVFSWHEGNIGVNNMCLIGDASYVPIDGLQLYFQGGLDDVNLNPFGINDSSIPNVWAYEIGARHVGKIKELPYRASIELGGTNYLWGNFDSPGDIANNDLSRSIYRYQSGYYGTQQAIPLTSAYGPGTGWLIGKVSATTPLGLSATAKVTWLMTTPNDNLFTTPYQPSSALASAAKSSTLIAELIGRYQWKDYLDASVDPQFIVSGGKPSFALNVEVGAKLDWQKVFGS